MVEMKQVDLAEAAGVSKQTLVDFERGARTPHRNHIVAIRTALETAGVVFIDPNGGGPGVRLRE
ncbi:helix-turn-helix transcriptional regulator [Pelagibius litoralis]|uniref:Helix-turn-helix transcriptional regulator n=1 Tax=Pelagibius litoralis TaxID=374515 RepID=A0A967F2L8_9PROT|nr:helix-turn-helix transcriptional regulator [Pelagibius litoralis]